MCTATYMHALTVCVHCFVHVQVKMLLHIYHQRLNSFAGKKKKKKHVDFPFLYYSTHISSSSCLNHSLFSLAMMYCGWSCFFFFSLHPRFPSLSSLGRKCIRALYAATWARFLINIHHSTGKQKKKKKRRRRLCALQSPKAFLPLSGEREPRSERLFASIVMATISANLDTRIVLSEILILDK